jgi:hypothetical protein
MITREEINRVIIINTVAYQTGHCLTCSILIPQHMRARSKISLLTSPCSTGSGARPPLPRQHLPQKSCICSNTGKHEKVK